MFTKIKGTQTWLDYYYVAAFRKPYISLHKPYVSLHKPYVSLREPYVSLHKLTYAILDRILHS